MCFDVGVPPIHNNAQQEQDRDARRAMNLRLPEKDAKELELVAEVEGQSVAAIIRQAIRSHLDALAEDDDFRKRSRALLEEHTDILRRYAG